MNKFEVLQAEATSTGKQRRFSITAAHGYAALSYAFVQDHTEAGYNQNWDLVAFDAMIIK